MTGQIEAIRGQERLCDLFLNEGVEVISGIVDVHFMHFHDTDKLTYFCCESGNSGRIIRANRDQSGTRGHTTG